MRIVVIESENGEYRDESKGKKYKLLEVEDGLTIHTNQPIINEESADVYADKQKWKKEKKDKFISS